jgi:peptide/nickel transport system permease protein
MGLHGGTAQVSGEIELNGQDIRRLAPEQLRMLRGKAISMIFQEPSRSFDPIYNLGKTFEETFKAKNPDISDDEVRSRSLQLLSEVHIPRAEERLKNFPHQFSGGMLQRIMIALALANDPDVLIADEPTTALDVTIQAQIVALLKELQLRRGLSLIFISHDLGLVGQIADRIMVMYAGLVLEFGPASEVLGTPRSPYTRALLKSLPAWGSHYRRDILFSIPGGVPDPTRPEPGCPFEPRCPLASSACSLSVPPLVQDSEQIHGQYRCIVPGVKSE